MFEIVAEVAAKLIKGEVVHCGDVTVGNGKLIDWRVVKSGVILVENVDAFELAYAFTKLVGQQYALTVEPDEIEEVTE